LIQVKQHDAQCPIIAPNSHIPPVEHPGNASECGGTGRLDLELEKIQTKVS
jgi:hypothetical protein